MSVLFHSEDGKVFTWDVRHAKSILQNFDQNNVDSASTNTGKSGKDVLCVLAKTHRCPIVAYHVDLFSRTRFSLGRIAGIT